MKKQNKIAAAGSLIIISVIFFIVFISYMRDKDESGIILLETPTQSESISENATETSKLCAVQIVGEVVEPGVYYLPEGLIVDDVVKLAGGLTEAADISVTNLAKRVTDEMMIRIYSYDEVKNAINTSSLFDESSGESRININQANKESLMTLSGIGESRAEEIIRYRETNGAFKNIEDIMKVSGIKEALFNKIKEYIVV